MKQTTLIYLASRFLVARQKMTAVTIISWIAVLGMVISSAAIVILLSAFNGIEGMIEELYTSFDQEVVVRSKSGRKMDLETAKIYQDFGRSIEGVKNSSVFLQERVILRNKKKWTNAELWAIEPSFLTMSELTSGNHLINGVLSSNKEAIIGVGLANRLMVQSMNQQQRPIVLYYPKQHKKVQFGTPPFYQRIISLSGAMDYNKEVNENVLLVPLQWLQDYHQNKVSGVLFSTKSDQRITIKNTLYAKFSGEIEVLTNLEKNALIFKTSRSEKLIVLIILLFVFVLSLFNLAAAITMTFLEKKEGSITLFSLGMSQYDLRSLYFTMGFLIVFFGVLFGLLIGGILVSIHERIGLIMLPGSRDFFPSNFSLTQTIEVMMILLFLGTAVAYLTATYLIKTSRKETKSLRLE
ncbi:MAG: ABC transporter permease [Bacteroidota bacterium]